MTTFNPDTTALILIDLQQGIVSSAGGPRSANEVIETAAKLADRFRQANALVVLVHVDFSPDTMPSQDVDQPSLPTDGTPSGFADLVPGLRHDGDLVVLKHHWGAFTGTDLDLQLRRRGIKTVVIGGIATNMGVESAARSAWELSYNVVIAEDATASRSSELHAFAIENILPQIARIMSSADVNLASA